MPSAHPPPLVPAVAPSSLNETKLLWAIQTLDTVGNRENPASTDVLHVFGAWAFLLDITITLEQPLTSDARHALVLALEARVLSCIARFLRRQPPVWRQWSWAQCPTPHCVGRTIQTVACCFLFQLNRHASTAMLIVRSGLSSFLLDECRSVECERGEVERMEPLYTEARDLPIAIDPFDWTTRALWTTLAHDGATTQGFRIPIGARTLMHLLRRHPVPSNEVEDYGVLAKVLSRSPATTQATKTKPRRLPSIFTFPTTGLDEAHTVCCVCCPRYDSHAWSVVMRQATWIHLAVRAIVTLVLHVPSASPEGKALRRAGLGEVLHRVAMYSDPSASHAGTMTEPRAEDEVGMTAIRVMAQTGLKLVEPMGHSHDPSPARTTVSPSTYSSLGDKLHAIAERTRHETQQQRKSEIVVQHQIEHAALRTRVQEAYHKAMATRAHLLQSLFVLSSGRLHPAAHHQGIIDWLGSFPTLEKKEQQRREEEEMRRRRLLERQFQIDERRRRERDERATMEQNDCDALDTFAAERVEAQREAFAKLQTELRAMQAKEDAEMRARQENAMATKREAARNEARRLQILTKECHQQALEATLMTKEDHYYAEKLLREKRQRELQSKQARLVDPIVEQQKHIERMRRLDDEKKRSDQELEFMRSEDLLGRQRRFIDTEITKNQLDQERRERKQMDAEERFLRQQWKRIDEAKVKQQEDEAKQRRADERRAKRLQEHQRKQWAAAWTSCYDNTGHLYYYNQVTGESRWDNPLAYWPDNATTATTGAEAMWPGTS